MTSGSPTNLASKDFWENDYFKGIELPSRPQDSFAYERTLARALTALAPVARGQRVVEIGCAPARWLVWYAETFGAHVTGFEYTDLGVEISRRNLAAAGVEGEVRQGDFFTGEVGSDRFDLVLSLGFIEHFDDLDATFRRHVDFLAPGGTLAVGVPNFRGLTGLLQAWGDPGYLALHNRDAMRPRRHRQWAADNGLRLTALRFIDGIDPAMVRVSRRGPAAVLLPLMLARRPRLADHLNHRLLSSYMLAVYERPG